MMSIRRTLDDAGRMLVDAYGKEGLEILAPETFLANFISGYFPGGTAKPIFTREKKGGTKSSGTGAIQDLINHLRLKRSGRSKLLESWLLQSVGEECFIKISTKQQNQCVF